MAHYECLAVSRRPNMSGFPDFHIVDRLQELQNIGWSDELVGDGLGSISLNAYNIPSSVGRRFVNLLKYPTELWIYRDGELVHSGPIIGTQTQGLTVTLISRGRLYHLNEMFIQEDYEEEKDQYTIVQDLIDQWQDDEYGNFGIDTSSIGLSGREREVVYAADELRNVRDEIELLAQNVQGFDFYIDLSSVILGDGGSQELVLTTDRGSNKSNSVFLETRAISNALVWSSVGRDDKASWVRVLGASEFESVVATEENATVSQEYGKCGAVLTVDGIQTHDTAHDYAETLLGLMGTFHIEVGGHNENATAFPFPEARVEDFIAGDDISFIFDSGYGIINVARTVYKKYVSIDKSGTEKITVEFT